MDEQVKSFQLTPSPDPHHNHRVLLYGLGALLLILIAMVCGYILGTKNNLQSQVIYNKTIISPEPNRIISITPLSPSPASASISVVPHDFVVHGSSMTPNYLDSQIWIYQTYKSEQPKRFDVVIFDNPVATGHIIEKRIIGLPGEKVKITSGHVYINDQLLQESYTSTPTYTAASSYKPYITEGEDKVIPTNEYFVLGDNRPVSDDSRDWGLLPQERIIGKLTQQVQSLPMPTSPSQCQCLDSTNNLCLPQIACQ